MGHVIAAGVAAEGQAAVDLVRRGAGHGLVGHRGRGSGAAATPTAGQREHRDPRPESPPHPRESSTAPRNGKAALIER